MTRPLWHDIIRAGARTELDNHFTGSIVYIERDHGTTTSREPDLIIDGQQRVTTVTLLLAALAAHLEELPGVDQEPIHGFAPQKIRGLYLTNQYESGDDYFKLILTQRDKEALKAVVRTAPLPDVSSRVIDNYEYFAVKLREPGVDLTHLCRGLEKLVVVDVKLSRGKDDPQLVFESMNATGKKLSQADLIRNFILMDLPPTDQERLYEGYWFPMEKLFQGAAEKRFDEFVRHYLTLKSTTNAIPRIDEIYEAFKDYAFAQEQAGHTRQELVVDLNRHAGWFAAMALGGEQNPGLSSRFSEVDQLATVVYPFQLRLYRDYANGVLSAAAFAAVLDAVIAYVFRRAVCRIPTNSLNKTFATLALAIDPDDYVTSVCARLLTLPDYRRFPTDEEFEEALRTTDMYNIKRRGYFFRALENQGRKEAVGTAEYTIEHIMPQHATVQWQQELGPDWQEIHDRYLHTLGNLTLTGYNPEYSDRLFAAKRDMAGGFKDSPLRLNRGLGQLDRWGADEIEARARTLARRAVEIWSRPSLNPAELARFRQRFSDAKRFDWTQAHALLEAIHAGSWTNYDSLGDAIGTSAMAMASHMMTCGDCPRPYRVLKYNGVVADNFGWVDPQDHRDPLELLAGEGVRFVDGHADPEQKLTSEDLLDLVDDSDG